MGHLDDVSIELLLSGELDESEAQRGLAHLAECATCGRRLAAAREQDKEIEALLSLLDHPVPQLGSEDVMQRARRRRRHSHTAAAGIALLLLAGAASAVPGSPLRTWLAGFLGASPETSTPPAAEQGVAAGVSVVPTGEFELVFAAVQEAGVVRIVITDEPEVAVRAVGGAPGYSVEPDQVRIENAGSTADYEILLPRSARHVRIRVGDSVVFTKRDGSITTGAAPDAAGQYVLEFAALRPADRAE
jgi:anti-sigma factor RsiW